jgi:hypothetical protein
MPSYPDLQLFIGGEWKSADGAPVLNPADESVLASVPHATRADLDAALAAAESGFAIWRQTPAAKRAEIILKAAQLARQRVEEMAVAMTLEQGKPIAQSRLEIVRGCDIIEWDATEGRRVYGRIIPSEPGMRHTVLRQPIGIVAGFSPWNFPMSSPARKIAGALSAGCAIILKASEETPAGAVQLARAFHDAGLPPGVLNLVFGTPGEISEYLIPQPSVRLVTFTGSIPVGKKLAAMAGEHMKPAIMELGGHAPVIVCEDADPVHERRHLGDGKAAQCRTGVRLADALLRARGDLSRFHQRVRREGARCEGRRRVRSREPNGPTRQPPAHRDHGGDGCRRDRQGRSPPGRWQPHRQPRLLLSAHGCWPICPTTPARCARSPSARSR